MAEAGAARVVALERSAAFARFAGFEGGDRLSLTSPSEPTRKLNYSSLPATNAPKRRARHSKNQGPEGRPGPAGNGPQCLMSWLRHVLRELLPWKGLQRGLRDLTAGPAVPITSPSEPT